MKTFFLVPQLENKDESFLVQIFVSQIVLKIINLGSWISLKVYEKMMHV